MTENEAIKRLKYRIATATEIAGKGVDGNAYEDMEIAIKALEEIQKYRSIGTVEECRKAVEKQIPMEVTDIHVDEYYCPECDAELNCDEGKIIDKYCRECGQSIYVNKAGEPNGDN